MKKLFLLFSVIIIGPLHITDSYTAMPPQAIAFISAQKEKVGGEQEDFTAKVLASLHAATITGEASAVPARPIAQSANGAIIRVDQVPALAECADLFEKICASTPQEQLAKLRQEHDAQCARALEQLKSEKCILDVGTEKWVPLEPHEIDPNSLVRFRLVSVKK